MQDHSKGSDPASPVSIGQTQEQSHVAPGSWVALIVARDRISSHRFRMWNPKKSKEYKLYLKGILKLTSSTYYLDF